MSVCIAHFVVTAEATVDDLQCLFSQTLANIVVVSFDDWTEEDPSTPGTVEEAVQTLHGKDRLWDAFWIPHFAIVAKTTRISAVAVKAQIDVCPPTSSVFVNATS